VIVFDLKCAAQGHVFEGWFSSSEDYEDQCLRGLIQCPICGGGEVIKAVMAPRLAAKGNGAVDDSSQDEAARRLFAQASAAQKKLLESSTWVGDSFAGEARAIHLGDAEARAIHGRATATEVESLHDEGIPVAPLPFPLIPPREEN
jgi:hypothetical protein